MSRAVAANVEVEQEPVVACGRGLPLDPADRKAALYVLHFVRKDRASYDAIVQRLARHLGPKQSAPGSGRHQIRISETAEISAAERIVGLLKRTGRLVSDRMDRYRLGHDSAFESDVAGGMSGMEASAIAVCRLHFVGDDVARAAAFHTAVRNLFGLHAIGTLGAGAVLVPSSIVVRNGRVVAGSARAVVVDGCRIGIVDLPAEAFAAEAVLGSEGRWRVAASMDFESVAGIMVPDPALATIPILTVSGASRMLAVTPPRIHDALTASLAVGRSQFEEWMGRRVEDDQWRPFSISLRKGEMRQKGLVLQRMLCRLLEPEARRAALRDHKGDLGSYTFYHGPDARTGIWRRQASEAWPVLAGCMIDFVDEIDAGRPLSPVIAASLDLPEKRIGELRGITWRKAGTEFQLSLQNRDKRPFDDDDCILVGIRELPPSMTIASVPELPVVRRYHEGSRRGYAQGLDLIGHPARTFFGGSYPDVLRMAMARDLDAALSAMVDDRHCIDAVTGPAGFVGVLSDPAVVPGGSGIPEANRVLVTSIMGPEGSLKRWRRHGDVYHRNHPAVAAAVAAEAAGLIEDEGRQYIEWTPTPGKTWKGSGGHMRWLSTYEDLKAEGQIMRHCVESYFERVAIGSCCIAAVRTQEGAATAEFAISKKDGEFSLKCVQLRAVGNADPHPDCARLVKSFETTLSDGSIEPDWDAMREAAASNAHLVQRLSPFRIIVTVDPERGLDLVRPLLPNGLKKLSLVEIVSLVRAEEPFVEPPAEGWGAH